MGATRSRDERRGTYGDTANEHLPQRIQRRVRRPPKRHRAHVRADELVARERAASRLGESDAMPPPNRGQPTVEPLKLLKRVREVAALAAPASHQTVTQAAFDA